MAVSTYVNALGVALPLSSPGSTVVRGTAAAEALSSTATSVAFYSNGAADTITGTAGDDSYVISDSHAKIVEAPNGGIDRVNSTANYVLPDNVENLDVTGYRNASGTYGIGNALDNIIRGDGNRQVLDGGAGNDVLVGGGGGDAFVFGAGSGHDVITDFHTGVGGDTVSLKDYGFSSFTDVAKALTQVGSDVVLHLDGADDVTFRNADVGAFTASNFDLPLNLNGATLTFHDEFNDSALSLYDFGTKTGVWNTEFGFGGWGSKQSHEISSGTGEVEIYVDPRYAGSGKTPLGLQPFSESNGTLTITASQVPAQAQASLWGYQYDSGLITTRSTFAQTYGYFEMRAQLPTATGTWSGLWLLPASGHNPPEIDVLEALGQDPDVGKETVHDDTIANATKSAGAVSYTPGAGTGFHTYGVLWDPHHVTWYVDGREVGQIDTPADMNGPMYLLANVAVGGLGGAPDASQYPSQSGMKIDYIRAYALPDSPVVDPATTAASVLASLPAAAPPATASEAPPPPAPSTVKTFAGLSHDYAIALAGDATTGLAHGSVTGASDGASDLSGLDVVKFLDGELDFGLHSAAAQVYRLYEAALHRAPDSYGLNQYVNMLQAGSTIDDLTASAVTSPEFTAATAGLSDDQFIGYLYQNLLGRAPEASGLQGWEAFFAGGGTRAQMLALSSQSDEFIARTAPEVTHGLWVQDDARASIILLYDAAVQREPDRFGLDSYTAEHASGVSYRAIADEMAGSAEFKAKYAGTTDAQFVENLYLNVLHRAPDPGGEAAYVAALGSGSLSRTDAFFQAAFSPEHQALVLAHHDYLVG